MLVAWLPPHERDVLTPIEHALVRDDPEVSVLGRQLRLGDPGHEARLGEPVRDQLRHRDELQTVLRGELVQLGTTRHRAVGVQDLANDPDRREARELGEVHGRFGLTHAPEHPTGLRAEREDVARTTEIGGLGVGVGQHLDGLRPVVRADAGRNPELHVGIDRHRERRPLWVGVPVRHEREIEFVRALGREGDADQSTAMLGHEIDVIGRDGGGGHHEVALVLSAFVVRHDDHPSLTDLLDGVLDGIELHIGSHSLASSDRAARILPTYFPIRSPSTLTGAPGRSAPRLVCS